MTSLQDLLRKQGSSQEKQALDHFLHLRSAFHAYEAEINTYFSSYGISEGKFHLLLVLYEQQPEGVSPTVLAKRLEVTKGNITGLLTGLEKSQHIQRISHPHDQRRQVVRLTLEGNVLVENIIQDYPSYVKKRMSPLNQKEQKQLIHLLSKLFTQ